MLTRISLRLPIPQADCDEERFCAAAHALHVSRCRVQGVRLLKESLDARQRTICKQLECLVAVDESLPPKEPLPAAPAPVSVDARRVIIVGSGPGGLFAALRCLELGLRPILLERGKDVSARRFDLQPINCRGYVVEDSNYCFGSAVLSPTGRT